MQPVLIIGAGIAGLTLAQCLRIRSIPAIVFEAKPKGKFGNHGLWLGGAACQMLSTQLKLAVEELHKKIAVTAEVDLPHKKSEDPQGVRANKRRLLDLLSGDLDIRWEHKLKSIGAAEARQSVSAAFDNGESFDGSLLVGADGVHSHVRSELLPHIKPSVLPFVSFNGQRRIPLTAYRETISPPISDANTVKHVFDTQKTACLSMGINDVKDEKAYSYWIYSRPAKDSNDPLFKPDRSTKEASDIPSELYDELDDTIFSKELNRESTEEDKILSWLMRSVRVSRDDLDKLPTRAVLIGDSAHGTPILGGDGGEQAILDAVELATKLGQTVEKPEQAVASFFDGAVSRWADSVNNSETRLKSMHHL